MKSNTYNNALREGIIQPVVDGTNTVGKVGYVVGIEISGLGDIARIGAGIDPYTGKELSTGERIGEWAEWVVVPYGIGKISNINKTTGDILNASWNAGQVYKGYNKTDQLYNESQGKK